LSDVEVSLSERDYMATRADLLHGTLDLLILQTFVPGSLHGLGISTRLRQLPGEAGDP
jgi:hypothetical protein